MHDGVCARIMSVYIILFYKVIGSQVSQPEHDLKSETTRQQAKCVTWAQSFLLSMKAERQLEDREERGEGEGFYQPTAL